MSRSERSSPTPPTPTWCFPCTATAPPHLAVRREGSPPTTTARVPTRGAGAAPTRQPGEQFAGLLQRELVARTDLLDCGIHGKTWDLLRRTRMPAVRLEVGYVTHPGDAARLADPAFRDTVAEAVNHCGATTFPAARGRSPHGRAAPARAHPLTVRAVAPAGGAHRQGTGASSRADARVPPRRPRARSAPCAGRVAAAGNADAVARS